MEPLLVLPLRVKVDLRAIAMNEYSTYSKAPHNQIV